MTPRFLLLIIVLLASMSASPGAAQSSGGEWWNEPYPTQFAASSLKPQSAISVKKNRFVDAQGNPLIFRGVNIADPDKLLKQKQWRESLFSELVNNWGVNIVRLPVHPVAWRSRGKQGYLELLDQAVRWANKLGVYLIIDWHSIGNLVTEQYQHPMYDTTIKETRDFWRTIAHRYKGVSTVAAYELFNEPTTYNDTLGAKSWPAWKALNESLIDMIRAQNEQVVVLVAGFNWAYDLTDVRSQPIARAGIGYVVHPYPQKAKPEVKSKENFFKAWEQSWGFVAKKYPVIATELGWTAPDGFGAHVPVMDDGSYGPRIIEFMNERAVSWTVWAFDPEWAPTMIADWSFKPTAQGAFFKQVMLDEKRSTQAAPAP